MNKAVFLDKDGTLIDDIPYNINPDLITLSKRCTDGLRQLQLNGFFLIIITNQAGIAKGYFSAEQILPVKLKIENLLNDHDISLNGFYYCPHFPNAIIKEYAINCECRKPKPGLLFTAANEMDIDLSQSWMIGDILNDIEAGNIAGCRSILVDNGNETEWVMNKDRLPEKKVHDINEAAAYILAAM